MKRVLIGGAAALLLLALMPAPTYAQASITGVVRDSSGAVLPGVTVEAASPSLIEKVRTAVTDGSGTYRITELRPGAYTVTFTLPGFNTVKRDGINLTGAFTASVDAEMRVGALEETITVTGEAPIVDVQSSTRQRVMDADAISTLPTGRNMFELGVLIPGVSMVSQGGTLANHNVGGALGPETRALGAHGGRTEDQRFMMNGVSLSSMIGGGWGGGAIPNATGLQEMVFDTAAVIGRTGDRRRAHQLHRARRRQPVSTGRSSAASRTTRSRRPTSATICWRAIRRSSTPAASTRTGTSIPASAVRIKRDKLWFFASGRYQGAYLFAPGMFYNQNANNPAQLGLRPRSRASRRRSRKSGRTRSCVCRGRPSQKNKIGFTYTQQDFCACHDAITRHGRARSGQRPPVPHAARGAARLDLAGHQPDPDRGERHPPRRALGQHAPADQGPRPRSADDRRGRTGRRHSGHCAIAAQPERTADARRHLQQLVEQQLPLALPRVVHHRLARVQGRRERRASATTTTRPTSRTRCRTASTTACRTRSRCARCRTRVKNHVDHDFGHLRAGQVDDRPADALGRHPLRLPRQQLPRADARADVCHADPELHVPRAGQPELPRHHAEEPGGRTTCSATARRRSRSA